jgi:hypothetical protein
MKRTTSAATTTVTSIGLLATAILLAACGASSDSATAPVSLQLTGADSAAAVVQTSGQVTVGDLDVMNSSASSVGFQVKAGTGSGISLSLLPTSLSAGYAAATSCVFSSTTNRFTCPSVTNNGLTLTRSFEFFDASGNPMTTFNDTATASVDIQTTESGVRPLALGADTVSRARDLTASGLAGHNTTRIWNGTGNGTEGAYWVDSVATRTAHVTWSTTFTNIVVQLPRLTNPWPISGTIMRQVNGTGTVTKPGWSRTLTVSRTVTITFNGTEFVPMTIGSTNYTLDLATGTATKN